MLTKPEFDLGWPRLKSIAQENAAPSTSEATSIPPESTNGVKTITIPVPGDGKIAHLPELELHVGDSKIVGVAEKYFAGEVAVDTDCVRPITIPVAEKRKVSGVPKVKRINRALGVAQMPLPGPAIEQANFLTGGGSCRGGYRCGKQSSYNERTEERNTGFDRATLDGVRHHFGW